MSTITEKAVVSFCVMLVVVVVAFIGYAFTCEVISWRLHEGEIVDKSYHPQWTQISVIHSSKSTIIVPIHHPEHWTITIEGDDQYGKHRRRSISVSHSSYDALKVGEHYVAEASQ